LHLRLAFFNNAAPGFLSKLGPVIAYLKALDCAWTARTRFLPFAKHLAKAILAARAIGEFPLQVTSSTTEIHTDATPTQLGIVFPSFSAAAITPHDIVYATEARAADWAVAQPLLPRATTLRIDNAALVFALKKGRSNHPAANRLCENVYARRKRGYFINSLWISTVHNLADAPSRMVLRASSPFFVSPVLAKGLLTC
jgi:hypothetical protein